MELTENEKKIAGMVLQGQMKHEKELKVERFRRLNRFAKKGQVVFAGSSLMEQFPINEFLMDFDIPLTIYNRGIGGYTTEELLAAMGPCIYDLKPAYLFLNIGTNDLNGPDYDKEKTFARYHQILTGIRENLPEVKLYLLAYYPVNPVVGNQNFYMAEIFKYRTNDRINEANEEVKKLAAEFGAAYLDLNDGLKDADGNLRAEYTIEGMHFYADGYQTVLERMMPVLKQIAEELG